jgi:hypothetical protein
MPRNIEAAGDSPLIRRALLIPVLTKVAAQKNQQIASAKLRSWDAESATMSHRFKWTSPTIKPPSEIPVKSDHYARQA